MLGERIDSGPNGPQAVGSLAEVVHALTVERLLFLNRSTITLGIDEAFKLNEQPGGTLNNLRFRAAAQLR